MFIFTNRGTIMNSDHIKTIECGRDRRKYIIMAKPLGTITDVDTEEDAKKVISYLYDRLINNVPVDFRYLKW